MPELPEVETVKNGMSPHCVGATIIDGIARRANIRYVLPADMIARLTGCKITDCTRIGKYIILPLQTHHSNTDHGLLIHLGMSGQIIMNPTTQNSIAKHCHISLSLDNGMRIDYCDPRRFGMVDIIRLDDRANCRYLSKMGHDPFTDACTGDYLYDKIITRTSSIKSALLDQHIIAGIGNIYACEILWRTAISPLRTCNSLSRQQCHDLVRVTRDVLGDAITAGGSSLRDFVDINGKLGYFQHQFDCYDQADHLCSYHDHNGASCTGNIIAVKQHGRTSFYCPDHQK